MFRLHTLLLTFLAGLAAAQTPGNSTPARGMPTPRPAHSEPAPAADGTRANPADPASPPLADPLKQQAVTDSPPPLATPAVQFIMQASMDGLAELEMAQTALTHSTTPRVRRFARRIVADHHAMNSSLAALAMQEGTSVPSVLDIDHAAQAEKLSALSGRAFDSAYAAEMVSAHDRAVALYTQAGSLSDIKVAAFAAGAIRVLRSHRSSARSLEPAGTPRVP